MIIFQNSKVIPYDYNRMQMAIVQMEEKGLNAEQAQIEDSCEHKRVRRKMKWENQQDLWNMKDVKRVGRTKGTYQEF